VLLAYHLPPFGVSGICVSIGNKYYKLLLISGARIDTQYKIVRYTKISNKNIAKLTITYQTIIKW